MTLLNEATGTKLMEISGSDGEFLFVGILPSRYTITVETKGFKKAERPI